MGELVNPSPPPRVLTLIAQELTPEAFLPYGQVVRPVADNANYGPDDAQLDLSRGVPRFYIMRLEGRSLKFGSITHHANVTQCLGAVSGACWYLGVARASVVSDEAAVKGLEEIGTTDNAGLPSSEVDEKVKKKLTKSRAGHCYVPPSPDDVTVFRIDGPQFVKLHRGTWHVGPLFTVPMMDFYNLELSNTQPADETTHSFKSIDGVTFKIHDHL